MLEAGYAIWPGVSAEVLAGCLRLTEARVEGGGTRRLFERIPELADLLVDVNAGPDMVLCRRVCHTCNHRWRCWSRC